MPICPDRKCNSAHLTQRTDNNSLMDCQSCGASFVLNPTVSLRFDSFSDALRDGAWHSLKELSEHSGLGDLAPDKFLEILNFLKKYRFIEMRTPLFKDPTVRLALPVWNFLVQMTKIESKT